MSRRLLYKLLLGASGSYLALLGLARLSYRSLLYPAPKKGLDRNPRGGTLLHVDGHDAVGVPLAVYPDLERLPQAVIVYLHGNMETLLDSVPVAAEINARGLGFVAVEYRGYGGAAATEPDERGLYADAEAALRHLHRAGITPDRITLWGNSLGTGVAVEMARRGHGARLVLQAPFTSIPDVAGRLAPWLPAKWIIGDAYDSAAKAPELDLPALVLHGDADPLVPYDMGVALAEALPRAELVTVAGGSHSDLFVRERDRLLDRIVAHAAIP
ncbi:MAG: alpha/beta fold hydrolase [Myxococcota bacterium]